MAQAFAEKHGLTAESAGTIPAHQVNPAVVQAMLEKEIDISHRQPKMLTSEMIDRAKPRSHHGLPSRGSLSQTHASGDAEEAG